MRKKERTTIALLGTDTVVGQTLSLLLQGEGYEEIRMMEAPRRARRRIRWREWTCS